MSSIGCVVVSSYTQLPCDCALCSYCLLSFLVDFLCVKGEAIGEKGNRVESIFYLNRDAGCLETSRMLVEAGLSLALQEEDLPVSHGGFQSTAYGLGDILLQRLLLSNAKTVFETQVLPSSSVRSKL